MAAPPTPISGTPNTPNATLADLQAGDEFLFVAQVTAIDPTTGYSLSLFGPQTNQSATGAIDPTGAITGQLLTTPDQIPVTIVTGFAPIAVGDVMVNDNTGETMVARASFLDPAGKPMWSATTDSKVVYSADGWTKVGHVDL